MSRDYAYNLQPNSITVHFMDGDVFTWPSNHGRFADVRDAIRDGIDSTALRGMMDAISTVQTQVAPAIAAAGGTITVSRDGVMWNGQPIHLTVTDRIIEFYNSGLPIEPLVKFVEKLLSNPRRSAVMSLYDFLCANNVVITEDGDFLVYKRVRGDYLDIHSGTMDNSVGKTLRVPAWMVEEDRSVTCAKGLHVCARHYLPSFGDGAGNRVVICKVNPADVVAVPFDYNNAKMRVCGYEVVGELSDAQKAEVLDQRRFVKPSDDIDGVTWGDNFASDPDSEGCFDPDFMDDDDPEDEPVEITSESTEYGGWN